LARELAAIRGGGSGSPHPGDLPLHAASEVHDALMTRMGRHFDLFAGLRRDEAGQAERILEGANNAARARVLAYWERAQWGVNDYQDALFALEWATRGLESGGLDLLLEIESFNAFMCEAVLEVLAMHLIGLAPWAPARPPPPSLSAAELRRRRALIRKAEAFAYALDQHEGLGTPLAGWTRRYAKALRASLEGRAVAPRISERLAPPRSEERVVESRAEADDFVDTRRRMKRRPELRDVVAHALWAPLQGHPDTVRLVSGLSHAFFDPIPSQ
jgi:hypothetical protein